MWQEQKSGVREEEARQEEETSPMLGWLRIWPEEGKVLWWARGEQNQMRPVCVLRNPLTLAETQVLNTVFLPVVLSVLHLHLGSMFSGGCGSWETDVCISGPPNNLFYSNYLFWFQGSVLSQSELSPAANPGSPVLPTFLLWCKHRTGIAQTP